MTGYTPTPDYYNDYIQHYGIKGMKWKNRKKSKLKSKWETKELHSTATLDRLKRQGFKDFNATSQNRDQQFYEQRKLAEDQKNKQNQIDKLKRKKETLKTNWGNRDKYSSNLISTLKRNGRIKDHNATSQNRDQQYYEQSLTRNKKKKK